MIVVTNTIKIKKGHGEIVAQRFQHSKGVDQSPGFVKIEVLLTEGLEEYDELKVSTTWQDKVSFDNWVNSDSFRDAHAKRSEQHHASAATSSESIMLGSQLSIHKVLLVRKAEQSN